MGKLAINVACQQLGGAIVCWVPLPFLAIVVVVIWGHCPKIISNIGA
jgi:hypothetical protein